ncbi:MAG: DUF5667 domain-containing protein [Patescibacteria group bacterium]|nr:DUF5667 domain-containing protein [Patescibacteria group bacterium]
MNSLKVFILSFALGFTIVLIVTKETTSVGGGYAPVITVEEAVNLDENVQPQDLGISEPKLLPDSPFYFLKNWARGIQNLVTINPVKKAELRMKFANEKLMEVKKIVELKKNPEIIKKATENYQQEVERIKKQAEKIKEKVVENPQVESFFDIFIHQQTLHQKLLQKLETQVPSEVFEKIKKTREEHLERFKDVMLKLEDRKEKITEKLDKILEKHKGSKFKNFKNLEVLKNLEEKVPEEAKEAIQKAQENALKRLQEDLERMSPEDQEKFKEYLEKISGDKEKQLEIMENLKARIKKAPATPIRIELKKILQESEEEALEKIAEKLEKLDCPLWTTRPAPGFCKEGRVVFEKDPETGCPLPPKCIVPGEIEIPEKPGKPAFCITLWDPVCGKDGKTYSNECFAKLAGVEIDYKGKCEVQAVEQPIQQLPTTEAQPGVCIQVITPAISPEGVCKEFPTPCDVPADWKKIDKCPEQEQLPISIPIEKIPSEQPKK